jgi:hypothetical protein
MVAVINQTRRKDHALASAKHFACKTLRKLAKLRKFLLLKAEVENFPVADSYLDELVEQLKSEEATAGKQKKFRRPLQKFPSQKDLFERYGEKCLHPYEILIKECLIPNRENQVCSKCSKGRLTYAKWKRMWKCNKKFSKDSAEKPCKEYTSLYDGSIFEGSKGMTPAKVLLLARHMLEQYTPSQSANELGCDQTTIWRWRLKLKAIIASTFVNEVRY